MAKGQQRTGREAKKPKQDKSKSAAKSAYRTEMSGKPSTTAIPPRKG